jgi:hypothetical protein
MKKDVEEYIKKQECPKCHGINIIKEGLDEGIEAGVVYQKVSCCSCEQEWNEVYYLKEIKMEKR